MSYEKAMKHSRNHRKDRYTQQCGGPAVDAFVREQVEVKGAIPALPVLDKLEAWRRERKHREPITVDFAYRYAAHLVASDAGYVGRESWRTALDSVKFFENKPEGELDVLLALMRLENRRIKCAQEKALHPDSTVNHEILIASAIIAKAAGYADRNEWTNLLKQDEKSQYHRDWYNPDYPSHNW